MIEFYTDGSCLGNPGPGGWAAVTLDGLELKGQLGWTTNNEMELTAIREVMLNVLSSTPVKIWSDSEWAIKCIKGEYHARGARVTPLVAHVNTLITQRIADTQIEWLRGHNGDKGNERADALARTQALQAKQLREQ